MYDDTIWGPIMGLCSFIVLGSVVQNIVSLMSLLVVRMLTVLLSTISKS